MLELEKMWNNRDPRITEMDVWMPESKNADSGVPGLANADFINERLTQFGGKEFHSLPYNSRETSKFSVQGTEPLDRRFWPNSESQSQALSLRKHSNSANGRRTIMDGFHLERASTCARAGSRDEDLYLSQGVLPIHNNSSNHLNQADLHTQHRVPYLEEELYSVMNPRMNHRLAAPQSQVHAGNSYAMKKGIDSHRAAFEGAMMTYNTLQTQSHQYERSSIGPSDYPMPSLTGPYGHPYARFQECNGQFSGDSYSLQVPSGDGPFTLPKPLHQLTGLPLPSQRDSLVPTSKCACCKDHGRMQLPSDSIRSFGPYAFPAAASHYLPLGYHHLQTYPHFQGHTIDGKFRSFSSQSSLHSVRSRHRAADSLSQAHSAALARKENRPPLPGPHSPPYVLCQQCGKVVQIPAQLHFEGAVLKLRCSACRSISKFCNIVHPCYQALFKEERTVGSTQRANSSDSLNQQKLFSTAATAGIHEPDSIVQVPMSAKLAEDFRTSCVVGGQHEREVKQSVVGETNGTADDVQHFDAFTPKKLLEQGPFENAWKGGGSSFRPWSMSETLNGDSSSLFSVSGSVSTKNTAGLASHESEQLDTNFDFVSQCPMPMEGEEAKLPSDAADSTYEQSDNRLRLTSEELEGLMLECLQGSSYIDREGNTKFGITSQDNGSQQSRHDGSISLNNNDNQRLVGVTPREQFHHLKQNEPVKFGNNSDQRLLDSSPREQIDGCLNQEVGPNKVEVSNEGANSAPGPGLPLYEHLSYDSASEGDKALKNDGQGKQVVGASCIIDTGKGSNFLTSFLRKSISLGHTGQGNNKNMCVEVNGAIIPPDAIKSAEKQAGTIRPGVYWYDYQAGFWGVMGGPCLGIIPPFITEFNLPLARHCAGGTTGVFVNGRELHKKDLDALAGRGLPRTAGKAYMVDISGHVVDGSSGQVLRSLGRLAPTVQKRGRGCGMFQPPTVP